MTFPAPQVHSLQAGYIRQHLQKTGGIEQVAVDVVALRREKRLRFRISFPIPPRLGVVHAAIILCLGQRP